MTWLVALDPGTHTSGLAIFKDGKLVRAKAVKVDAKRPLHARIQLMILALVDDLFDTCDENDFFDFIAEFPVVYPQRKREDPNDLLPLAGVVHGFRARLGVYVLAEWYVSPAGWKGQRPKPIIMAHVMDKLSDDEKKVIENPSDDNCVESIGIGMTRIDGRAP